MLSDLTKSLSELLTKAGFLEAAQARLSFDRPAEPFSPSQPTLGLYLFDVRENTELRSVEATFERRNGVAVAQRPALRVAASYLITAWSGGGTGDDAVLLEHRLLSEALLVFARNPRVPANCLQGKLKDQLPTLPMVTAQAEGLKNPSEFWNSINNKLRPSLTVSVTFSMPLYDNQATPLVTTSELRLSSDGQLRSDRFSIGGRVSDASNGSLRGATVTVLGRGLKATTDVDGTYVLGALDAGVYVLRVACDKSTTDFNIEVPPAPGNPPGPGKPLPAPAAKTYDLQLN